MDMACPEALMRSVSPTITFSICQKYYHLICCHPIAAFYTAMAPKLDGLDISISISTKPTLSCVDISPMLRIDCTTKNHNFDMSIFYIYTLTNKKESQRRLT